MECRKEESMTEKYFPQVGDNELMLKEMPHMNLYDETDLISNITGDYVDKNYLNGNRLLKTPNLSILIINH